MITVNDLADNVAILAQVIMSQNGITSASDRFCLRVCPTLKRRLANVCEDVVNVEEGVGSQSRGACSAAARRGGPDHAAGAHHEAHRRQVVEQASRCDQDGDSRSKLCKNCEDRIVDVPMAQVVEEMSVQSRTDKQFVDVLVLHLHQETAEVSMHIPEQIVNAVHFISQEPAHGGANRGRARFPSFRRTQCRTERRSRSRTCLFSSVGRNLNS